MGMVSSVWEVVEEVDEERERMVVVVEVGLEAGAAKKGASVCG